MSFTIYCNIRSDIFLGKYWEHDKDRLLISAYICGFSVTFFVVIGTWYILFWLFLLKSVMISCKGDRLISNFSSSMVKCWFFAKFALQLGSLILEITANGFLWEFIYEWYNNTLLNNGLWSVDPPAKLLVSTGAEAIAVIILGFLVILNLAVACKNQGFKQ